MYVPPDQLLQRCIRQLVIRDVMAKPLLLKASSLGWFDGAKNLVRGRIIGEPELRYMYRQTNCSSGTSRRIRQLVVMPQSTDRPVRTEQVKLMFQNDDCASQ